MSFSCTFAQHHVGICMCTFKYPSARWFITGCILLFPSRLLKEGSLWDNNVLEGCRITLLPNVESGLMVCIFTFTFDVIAALFTGLPLHGESCFYINAVTGSTKILLQSVWLEHVSQMLNRFLKFDDAESCVCFSKS